MSRFEQAPDSRLDLAYPEIRPDPSERGSAPPGARAGRGRRAALLGGTVAAVAVLLLAGGRPEPAAPVAVAPAPPAVAAPTVPPEVATPEPVQQRAALQPKAAPPLRIVHADPPRRRPVQPTVTQSTRNIAFLTPADRTGAPGALRLAELTTARVRMTDIIATPVHRPRVDVATVVGTAAPEAGRPMRRPAAAAAPDAVVRAAAGVPDRAGRPQPRPVAAAKPAPLRVASLSPTPAEMALAARITTATPPARPAEVRAAAAPRVAPPKPVAAAPVRVTPPPAKAVRVAPPATAKAVRVMAPVPARVVRAAPPAPAKVVRVAPPAPARVASLAPAQTRAPAPVRQQAAVRKPAPAKQAQKATARKPAPVTERAGLSRGNVSLIGVFGGGDGRHALLLLPDGSVERVKAGDRIRGVQVASIDTDSVRLSGSGRDTLLRLPD